MNKSILICLVTFTILTGCIKPQRPDLKRLYNFDTQVESAINSTPLILIHGTLGSKIKRISTDEEVWPDNLRKLAFSKYRNLAYNIDPHTLEPVKKDHTAFAIIDNISGFNVYEEIIETLTQYGNYQLTDINAPYQAGRKLYIFNYDWRQDNVHSAQQLDKFINAIQKKHPNKQQKVDIVAHSMGGLITRYYMRYGTDDVLNDEDFISNSVGAQNIRQAIFLGTPNLGSVLSVNRLVNGFRFGLRTIPIEVMITMPSVYQLLPHNNSNWVVDLKGENIDIDIFDQKTWQKYQWAIYNPAVQKNIIDDSQSRQAGMIKIETLKKFFNKNLNRSRQFLQSLTIKPEVTAHQFIIMGGDCKKTPARLVMEKTNDRYVLRTRPSQVFQKYVGIDYEKLMLKPGDGQVTKLSLLSRMKPGTNSSNKIALHFPMKYPILLCESHLSLTSNITFQDNLLDILLSRDY